MRILDDLVEKKMIDEDIRKQINLFVEDRTAHRSEPYKITQAGVNHVARYLDVLSNLRRHIVEVLNKSGLETIKATSISSLNTNKVSAGKKANAMFMKSVIQYLNDPILEQAITTIMDDNDTLNFFLREMPLAYLYTVAEFMAATLILLGYDENGLEFSVNNVKFKYNTTLVIDKVNLYAINT